MQDERVARPMAQARTRTALLLMAVAFALLWIPYVSELGGIIALVGVIYFWLGRNGFDSSHRTNVILGGTCILVAWLIGIVVAVWFTGALLSAASSSGATLSSFGSALQSDLGILFVAGLGSTGVFAIAYVVLPYALADRTSRMLLVVGAALTVVISFVGVAILWPQISSAVAQATSGSGINTAPISSLQGESYLLGAAQFVPDMILLYAYTRIRRRTLPDHRPASPPAPPSASFARTN